MGDERRITQILAEVDQEQDTDRRITQVLAEVDQVQDTNRRITQILAEVDQDATEEQRVTQLLLEVDYLEGAAVLSIEKTGNVGPATIGDMLSYVITIENVCGGTVHNIVIDDATLGIVGLNIGDLDPGETHEITPTYGPVTADDIGLVTNTAIASSDEAPTVEASWSVSVVEPPAVALPCEVTWLTAQYIVRILDSEGNVLAYMDNFETLEYTRTVNGMGHHSWGSYVLTTYGANPLIGYFAVDRIVEIRRKPLDEPWDRDFDGLHRQSRFFYDESDKEHFVSVGPDLKSLLKRPIIRPDAAADFFTRTDEFTDIMRELVRYQMGPLALDAARIFPNVVIQDDTSQGASFTRNVRHVKLYQELETLSGLGADFDLVRLDPFSLSFQVYYPRLGVDRRVDNADENAPVVFSLEMSNMRSPAVVSDRTTEVTMTFVAGDGIGAGREIVERFSIADAQYDSPWNRIEEFLEASQDASTAVLNAYGDGFLAEKREQLTFSCEALPTISCLYGRDWDLGDLVTGRYRGEDYDLRVVEVKVLLDSTGEHIIPTFLYLPEEYL